MASETNFYSVVAKLLIVFNFLSVFFTFTILLFYAFVQYIGLEFLSIADSMFGTSGFWFTSMVSLFQLLLEIPGGLDTLFLAIIVLSIMNVIYIAYKTQKGGWIGFFFFISIGLPIWLWIGSQVVSLRNSLLEYLNNALLIKPDSTFFDYFTMYSLEIGAAVFIVAIIVHMIDWENVRDKIQDFTARESASTDLIEERFEQ